MTMTQLLITAVVPVESERRKANSIANKYEVKSKIVEFPWYDAA